PGLRTDPEEPLSLGARPPDPPLGQATRTGGRLAALGTGRLRRPAPAAAHPQAGPHRSRRQPGLRPPASAGLRLREGPERRPRSLADPAADEPPGALLVDPAELRPGADVGQDVGGQQAQPPSPAQRP